MKLWHTIQNAPKFTKIKGINNNHTMEIMKLKSEKAQVRMTETIAILFIFFLLVLFGMIFYMRIQNATLEREQEEDVNLKAIQTAQKASYFPEFQCTTQAELPTGCIDIYKLEAFQKILEQEKKRLYYFEVFEYSNVYVEQVYPENKSWNIYDLKKPSYKGELKIPVPVALHDPVENTMAFGVLHVDVYI
jgi:hypothetical protein